MELPPVINTEFPIVKDQFDCGTLEPLPNDEELSRWPSSRILDEYFNAWTFGDLCATKSMKNYFYIMCARDDKSACDTLKAMNEMTARYSAPLQLEPKSDILLKPVG